MTFRRCLTEIAALRIIRLNRKLFEVGAKN